MRRALLAELGARCVYGWLVRLVRDRELRGVLGSFLDEEAEQIDALRRVMIELGGAPPRTSRRRRALATLLALTVPVIGSRPALRICEEAEGTAARWYGHFREILMGDGRGDLAVVCERLATTKLRHARALEAWVRNRDPA
jgi:rubrerythrin